MDFKLTIDLAPDVKELLSKLLNFKPKEFATGGIVSPNAVTLQNTEQVKTIEKMIDAEEKKSKEKKTKPAAALPATNGIKLFTLEEVRAKATTVSDKGPNQLAAVKALIKSYGAPKLTELKPEHYTNFMEMLDTVSKAVAAPKDEETL